MRRGLIIAVFVLGVIVLYGWRLGARSLWEPDEPRYAEIAREMVVSGDWVEPRLDFLKYYEKPPLTYWITAVSFSLFGMGETTARLGPAIAALALLSGTWFLGRILYEERTANIATLSFAVSPLAWVTGRLLLTDIFLAAGVVWAVAGYVMAAEGGKGRGRASAGMIVAGVALAIAWLAKGPIGLVIPFLGIVPHRWLGGKEVKIGVRGWLLLAGIFLLIGVPWFVAIWIRDPSFGQFFFFHEHVLRYFTPEARRQQPWHFYFQVLLVGLFPASVLLPWASYRIWPGLRPRSREDRGTCLLMSLGYATTLLFSLSHSKLATYVLPAGPAFALLIGRAIRLVLGSKEVCQGAFSTGTSQTAISPLQGEISPESPWSLVPRGLRVSLAVGAILGFAGAAAAAWFALHPGPYLEPGHGLFSVSALLGLLAATLAGSAWSGSRRVLSRTLLAGVCLCVLSLLCAEEILERIDPLHSVKSAALFVRARAGPDDLIASYGLVLHGLTFYTERRTAIIGGAGELTFGARGGAHQGWVVPRERLPELLSGRKVFVVLPKRLEERAVLDSGGRLTVLFRSPSYSVLGNS